MVWFMDRIWKIFLSSGFGFPPSYVFLENSFTPSLPSIYAGFQVKESFTTPSPSLHRSFTTAPSHEFKLLAVRFCVLK